LSGSRLRRLKNFSSSALLVIASGFSLALAARTRSITRASSALSMGGKAMRTASA